MERNSPGTQLAKAYEQARKSTLRNEHRNLTPKEFLDTVDPQGKRSAKSARDYLRRIVKGERAGSKIVQRADAGGGQYLVVFKRGDRETSAIVRVPKGKSNLGIYQGTRQKAIRQAATDYAAVRSRQGYTPPASQDQRQINYDRRWKMVSIRPLRETKHIAAIVRHKS